MKNYITFAENDLFSNDELDAFYDANPIKKAELISEKLIQYLIICQDKLYLYCHATTSYRHLEMINMTVLDYLLMIARKFGVNSCEQLHDDSKYQLLRLDFYRDFILDVYHLMSYDDIVFDKTVDQVHYRNGYFDLKTLKFKPRDPCKQYITKFYDHNFQIVDDNDNCKEPLDEEDEPVRKTQFTQKDFQDAVNLI